MIQDEGVPFRKKHKMKLDNAGGEHVQSGKAEELVAVARTQLDKKERSAGSDDIEYNAWFYGRHVDNNSGFYPWCATFVAWCADQVGILDTVIPKNENKQSKSACGHCRLYIVWKDQKPNTAKKAGIGALISVVAGVLCYALLFVFGMAASFIM